MTTDGRIWILKRRSPAEIVRHMRRVTAILKNFLTLVIGSIAAVLLFEGALRLLSLDAYFVARALYYQNRIVDLHQLSHDIFLHYEVRPGAMRAQPLTTINSHGARGREHPIEKGANVYRILMGGGSTTFGYEVADNETIPAALEQILNERARARGSEVIYEVWNFGVKAYTLSQVSRLLRSKLDDLQPNLLLVQLYNQGRRPYLLDRTGSVSRAASVIAERDALNENFLSWEINTHRSEMWFRRSAIFRVYTALERALHSDVHQSAWGDHLSLSEQHALDREAAERAVPVVYIGIPASRDAFSYYEAKLEVPPRAFIQIYEPGREKEYYDCHPPPPLLREMAMTIAAELEGRGYLADGLP